MFKRVLAACLCVVFIFAAGIMALTVSAEEVTKEREYKPLDLVVVVDGSGSMLSSDPDRTAPAAVRMLVNMMPAETSRVGIISFNTEPTVLTKDASGKDSLISLDSLSNVESVRSANSKIVYSGDTGIGNALYGAVELLKKNSDDDHDKAIILFTDGLNDFGTGPLAEKSLSDCDNNESAAIQWAKDNNCPMYCIGYDYKTSSGTSSMGEDGEGITKLTNIADTTNGKFQKITNINEAKQLLIEFLANVCDVIYKEIDVIPGDGGHHESIIPISPSVVEANIRIAGGDSESIQNGLIVLCDPSGKEIELKNNGNVRVDTDATAESIKIIMPTAGDWILKVDGIIGDDIEIGLLEHFKMNLTSELSFPEGNPTGVAYTNDTVGIRTWLSNEGNKISEQAIYDAVKSATATCTSRMDPNDVTVVDLVKNGTTFEGSFTVHQDSYYDILVRMEWDSVYREDTLEIGSSNKPLYFKDNNNVSVIEDVTVNKGKTVIIDDIFEYVKDDENDETTAEAVPLDDKVVDVQVSDDKIEITGKKWSSTIVTVTYTDAQKNTVSTTFKVTVKDPVAIALIIGGFILAGILVILVIVLLKKASNMVSGGIKVAYIAEGKLSTTKEYQSTRIIYENKQVDHDANLVYTPPATDTNVVDMNDRGFDNPYADNDSYADNDPYADDNPFDDDSFGNDSFGSNPYDDNAEPDNSSDSESGDFGIDQNTYDVSSARENEKEESQSETFDMQIPLRGGSHIKKTDLQIVLKRFLEEYKEHMRIGIGADSKKAKEIESLLNSISALKGIRFKGTAFGQFGVVMQVERSVMPHVYVHSPFLSKKRTASLNSKSKTHRISISFINDGKDAEGYTSCTRIELVYARTY